MQLNTEKMLNQSAENHRIFFRYFEGSSQDH